MTPGSVNQAAPGLRSLHSLTENDGSPIFAGMFASVASRKLNRAVLAFLVGAGLSVCARAQVTITGVTYGSLQNGTDRTNSSIVSLNEYRPVVSVSTSTAGNYSFSGDLASSVVFRRDLNSSAPNNSTVFYQYSNYSNGTATVYSKADNSPTLPEVMLSNDLTQGLRNPFANVSSNGSSTSLESNIERIDFYYSGGHVVQAGEALAFFDLENVGNYGDGFRIAVFTSTGTVNVDGTNYSNAPTAYANSGLLIQPDSFGNPVDTPTGTNARYIRSTTTSGDNLDVSQSIATLDTNAGSPNSSDLYLVGILISFADLGIANGTTIQGFSLMAGDVTPTNASSLVNWGNSSVYRTDTNASSWGNMDFMGFGAQIARPVPEPSTYGAIFVGLAAAICFWKRRKKTLSARAA